LIFRKAAVDSCAVGRFCDTFTGGSGKEFALMTDGGVSFLGAFPRWAAVGKALKQKNKKTKKKKKKPFQLETNIHV
jgi:hypothetical protein